MLRTVRNIYFAPDTGAAGGAGEGAGGDASSGTGSPAAGGESLEDIMTGKSAEAEPGTQKTDDKGNSGEGKKGAEGQEHPAWMQQLTEDMRADSELSKFKSLKELANAYKELVNKADGTVKPPAEDAKPEDVQAFFESLGKPKTADGYTLKAKDGEDIAQFKEIAFGANLTDAQAQAVYSALEKHGEKLALERESAMKKQYEETDAALRKEYGQKYSEKMELLKRGIGSFGGKAVQQKLFNAGLSFDPDFVHLFMRLGELGAEGGTVTQAAGGNAYKSVAEGGMIKFEHLDQIK